MQRHQAQAQLQRITISESLCRPLIPHRTSGSATNLRCASFKAAGFTVCAAASTLKPRHAYTYMRTQVRKLLGEGGSGQTWLCRDVQQRKMVAIKFIKRAIPKIVLPMLMHEIKVRVM